MFFFLLYFIDQLVKKLFNLWKIEEKKNFDIKYDIITVKDFNDELRKIKRKERENLDEKNIIFFNFVHIAHRKKNG